MGGERLEVRVHSDDVREYAIVSQASPFTFTDVVCVCLFASTLVVQCWQQRFVVDRFFCLTLAPLLYRLIQKRYTVKEESILVMGELGVQLKTTYVSGGVSRRVFLDKHRLRSVVINEGITRCRVLFYLAFVLIAEPAPTPASAAASAAAPLPPPPNTAAAGSSAQTSITPVAVAPAASTGGSESKGAADAADSKSAPRDAAGASASAAAATASASASADAAAVDSPSAAAAYGNGNGSGHGGAAVALGEPKLILAFQHSFPRLQTLLVIYRGIRHVLYGEPEPADASDADADAGAVFAAADARAAADAVSAVSAARLRRGSASSSAASAAAVVDDSAAPRSPTIFQTLMQHHRGTAVDP